MQLCNPNKLVRLFTGVFFTSFLIGHLEAYKFLAVLHFSSKSHFIVGSALMHNLRRNGHEVTVISPFPLKEPLQNYHDVPVPTVLKVMEEAVENLLDNREATLLQSIFRMYNMGLKVTEVVLNEASVQTLLASNQTFDAVICEVFMSEALYGLSEHFKAPLIGLSTFGAVTWNTDMVGSPSPLSYVPSPFLPFTDHMSLKERLANLAYTTFERLLLDLHYLPKQEKMYEKYFPNNCRSMYEVRKNTALVLLNSHVSLSYPRPYMPNQIEVGGMHIKYKRSPLPVEIERFINDSKHGVIYFSMGSNIKAGKMPIEKRQEILKAFKALKQRVLWKFENFEMLDKPENVLLSDWFPQDDILAHDNVKLFITHGGLLSTTESIYHGKPFIGIPIFGDQFLNMAKAVANGYALSLDYKTLNGQVLQAAIETMLSNSSYTKMVKLSSERYRDQPVEPLKLATYWTEYVVRHKGAKHLHSAGLDLRFLQYHNIDAMLILFGGLLLVVALVVCLLQCVFKQVFGKRQTNHAKKLKNN